ncbi:MAG: hypothetical protein AAF699_03950 [Pseudomonadota bacterium]
MSHNKTLFLHIGNHQAETIPIERALTADRPLLSSHGLTLFHSRSTEPRHGRYSHSWLTRDLTRDPPIEAKHGFFNAASKADGDVIISDEDFSYLHTKQSINHFVKRFKAHFGTLKVVAYLQRQDMQTISHRQQDGSSKGYLAAQFYGPTSRALPAYDPRLDQYLDYNQRLSIWADAVGDENMFIRALDHAQVDSLDVVSDFFQCLGIESGDHLPATVRSGGCTQTKVGHLVSVSPLSRDRYAELALVFDTRSQLLPSRVDAESFYSHYRESNRKLNQRFKINSNEFLFDEDFYRLPQTPQDIWTEEKANLAILKMLKACEQRENLTREEVTFFIECIAKVYQSDFRLADKLLTLARRLARNLDEVEVPDRESFISQLSIFKQWLVRLRTVKKGKKILNP